MQKLYVLTRDDLSPGQQAVQSAHAVAEFLLQHKTTWDNGTIVLLSCNRHKLELWEEGPLPLSGIPYSVFYEPDISAKTSIAFVLDDQVTDDNAFIHSMLERHELLLKHACKNKYRIKKLEFSSE